MEKTFCSSEAVDDRSPDRSLLEKRFPEWIQFERLVEDISKIAQVEVAGKTQSTEFRMPLLTVTFGCQDPAAPTLGLFAGVHGLERIGSQVVLSLLQGFSESLLWDEMLQETLKKIRVVFFPFINPLGILQRTRANPNGVDLMRNSPVEAEEKTHWLLGGHRYSPRLPWFRGTEGTEAEAEAVIRTCQEKFFASKTVITLDFHSGFGLQDQLWFPYAKSKKPFPHLAEFFAFSDMYEKSHPHHFYKIEPQALNYTTHGDLWDYIYSLYRTNNDGVYLPLALEMGSWIWLKKSPLQIFSSLGAFNPMRPHRQRRVLRRHQNLFEFLLRATASHQSWSQLKQEPKNRFHTRALERWYE